MEKPRQARLDAILHHSPPPHTSTQAIELNNLLPAHLGHKLTRLRSLSEISTAVDTSSAASYKLRKQTPPKWTDWFPSMWHQHVSLKVPVESRRDHLALERTFLSYLRTSLALSITGVTIAQLFRLQHAPHPDKHFGFFVVGTPLAACFIAGAIITVTAGAIRFWRQQRAMAQGKVFAGGWEMVLIMVLSILLSTAAFVVVVGIDIKKEI
ncbi:hypothetical protein EJ06DRAFT_530379 [Trichodelitschia bisporula]|uniref:DUF202 domain-containing protein n=1 Tax=Trichodelitschia bisporula TaxID=703511 RepID=A0A6G1HWW0_9PEZI|nr:hypothetical protein EJ06DRAFT_530379 [Trichodelitschia bisporula]